jgi:hypothetical protein
MSGISNTNIDVERLLTSISIVTKTEYKNKLPEIEGESILIQRFKTKHGNELSLDGKIAGKIWVNDSTEVTEAGSLITFKDRGSYDFKGGGIIIKNFAECEITDKPIKIIGHGSIRGYVEHLTIIGDELGDSVPNSDKYNTFSIGFRKHAISLIAGVSDARDYLYRWIYAHHKVVYFTQFLIPTLTQMLFKDDFNYSQIDKLDDPQILAKIMSAADDSDNRKTKQLAEEFLRRDYKISLYKSFAEYDLWLRGFEIRDKRTIAGNLKRNTDWERGEQDYLNGGFITEKLLKEIKEYAKEKHGRDISGITELIWADPSYNRKELNYNDVYIIFRAESLETSPRKRLQPQYTVLSDLDLFSDESRKGKSREEKLRGEKHVSPYAHYFYIYFAVAKEEKGEGPDEEEKRKRRLSDDLRYILKRYFRDEFL